jgi:hypothetical protein
MFEAIYTDSFGNEYWVGTYKDFSISLDPKKSDIDPNFKIYLPKPPEDNFLEFPGENFTRANPFYIESGISLHRLDAIGGFQVLHDAKHILDINEIPKISASEIEVYPDDGIYKECADVLNAHTWYINYSINPELVDKVAALYGENCISDAQERYGENFQAYLLELAAKEFCAPLSRLWYAANIMSLYYCHNDDFRAGFFWAEYRLRLRHQLQTQRGKLTAAAARRGGQVRALDTEAGRKTILNLMTNYVQDGHSISRAADLTWRTGFGSSKEANRKIWNRNQK